MDWEYVSRVVGILLDRQMYMAIRPSDRNNSSFTASVHNALIGLRNVDTMLEFHGDVNYKRNRDLALVLNECSTFGSTDPREKVFALLGLTTDKSKNLIKSNYDKEHAVKQVYTDTMLFILAKGDNPISDLEKAGIGTERSIRDLPSWVPDWSLTTPNRMSAKPFTSGTRYGAKINLDLSTDLKIALDGLQFDQIEILGSVHAIDNSLSMAESTSYTELWLAEAEALATAQIRDMYYNGESFLEAFIRTMLGNCATDKLERCPSTEQCHGGYEALKKFFAAVARMSIMEPLLDPAIPNYVLPEGFLEQPRDTMEKANRFLYFFEVATSLRRFCITEQGRMAIMPPRSLPGDVICIFKGAHTPFVLRQVSSEEPSVYNLVGCCYVHGVMDGEVDIQEPQTFVLV